MSLRINKKAAYRVLDDFETYQRLPDGSYLIEGLFPKSEWFLNQIINYGENCEVLEPTELKTLIKDKLIAILKGY